MFRNVGIALTAVNNVALSASLNTSDPGYSAVINTSLVVNGVYGIVT